MFTKDLRFVTQMHGSPETIFDLVADMPTYGSKKNSFVLLEAWLESPVANCRYRGRQITAADILYIGELIAANPGASRRTFSKKLCEAWEWRQPNGALRDMVCRGMLLMLDRAGQIVLPPVSYGGIIR